jgi:hypothetical protein
MIIHLLCIICIIIGLILLLFSESWWVFITVTLTPSKSLIYYFIFVLNYPYSTLKVYWFFINYQILLAVINAYLIPSINLFFSLCRNKNASFYYTYIMIWIYYTKFVMYEWWDSIDTSSNSIDLLEVLLVCIQ